MPERRLEFSARLPADLKLKLTHNGLDCLRRARVFFRVVEYNGQHKGTRLLLYGHPWVSEHHARASLHLDHMMVIINQLLGLFSRTNGNRLVGVNLIEGLGHLAFILQASSPERKMRIGHRTPAY